MARFSRKNTISIKRILSFFFIIIITFSVLGIQEINIFNQQYYDKNEILKTNAGEITIDTPEEITYTEPMTGYYPATYGFENDEDDIYGQNISFIDEYQGYADSSYTFIRTLTRQLDDHYRYIVVLDGQIGTNTWAVHNIDNPQSQGIIEFCNRQWPTPDYGSDEERTYFVLRASDNTVAISMQIDCYRGQYNYYTGSSWQPIANVEGEKWYHHRIEFDCNMGTNGQFTWIITAMNGTELGRVSNIEFENDFTGSTLDEIYIYTEVVDWRLATEWDAIGFSWDPNYNVGDNLKEGLFLSYTNSTPLDWIGYSLDGQTNRTILGNTTIPLPNHGPHTIQVFGETPSGNYYASDIKQFTIDIYKPEVTGIDVIIEIDQYSKCIINWTITSLSGGTYMIFKDGKIESGGLFQDNDEISINIDTSNPGRLNYTIIARDSYGRESNHTIIIQVKPREIPPIPGYDIITLFTVISILIIVISLITKQKFKIKK